jgi:hypothetical protein
MRSVLEMEAAETASTVQRVAFLVSALNHLRQNRLEYLLASILLYVTGAGATLLTSAQGVCA